MSTESQQQIVRQFTATQTGRHFRGIPEWTINGATIICDEVEAKDLTKSILSALAAERNNVVKARIGWEREVQRADTAEHAVGENCRAIERLEKELSAERQRREQAEQELKSYEGSKRFEDLSDELAEANRQLLSAQAAIEKHNKRWQQRWPGCEIPNVDLSLLHQHDDEVRKSLVEALRQLAMKVLQSDFYTSERRNR